MRLDSYIQAEIERRFGVKLSRTYVEKLLEAGAVSLLGEVIKKKGFTFDTEKHIPEIDEEKVRAMIVLYQTGKRQDQEAESWDASEEGLELDAERIASAGDIKPAILFEDDDMLVVHKPPGVSSHPGRGDKGADSMVYQYIKYMQSIHHYVPRAGLLHRLDKETQGILMFAKNMQTYNEVKKLFETRNLEKYYFAYCNKTPQLNNSVRRLFAEERKAGRLFAIDKKFTNAEILEIIESRITRENVIDLDGFIGKSRGGIAMVYSPDQRQTGRLQGVKNCISDVYAIAESEDKLLFLYSLHTGRTHQIRAQAKYLGATVVNDQLYGIKYTPGGTLGLCSVCVRFTLKGKKQEFVTIPKF